LFAGGALLMLIPALLLIASAVERGVYARATADMGLAVSRLRESWQFRDENLRNAALALTFDPRVAEAWTSGNPDALARRLALGGLQKEIVLAVDTAGRTITGRRLDEATLSTLATLARTGTASTLVVMPRKGDRTPLRLAASPVERIVVTDSSQEFVRLGMVAVGAKLNAAALRKELATGTDVALVVGDSIVGMTLSDTLDSEVRALDLRRLRAAVSTGPERVPLGGQVYLTTLYDLPTQGLPTSVLLFRPVTDELGIALAIQRSLWGIGAAALLLALLLAAVVSRIVARPTQVLAEASARLARGDYAAPLPRASDDEIGQLARAFGDMRQAIFAREQRLRSAQAEMIHREKLAAMGRLVAQLSHEINNPIYNIQNCLEALERRGDPLDPNREFLTLAQEELLRMAGLTRRLLDQSRPLSDAVAPTDLNALVRRVLTLAGTEMETRGVRVETALDPTIPQVTVHPEAIQQVLANLVYNAGDAMPGGGTLRVQTRMADDAVEVIVEDTGTGIAEHDLPHIFEAFYTTKPGIAGIGLGLFVSEGIVRGHRGRLSVESTVGQGSRFTVRLPRETLDETLADAPAEVASLAAD
ncbi:MAG: HAMP domain-containing protein, partial [Gemmatimonadetes bacterium]|nr:HAMP domain-containing protein [Gemmatimonadota bacterium]